MWTNAERRGTSSHDVSVGRLTMTAKSSNNDATTTVSRSYFSEYAGYATIFSWMLTAACCLAVGLGLGLDLVSGYAHVFVLLYVVIVRCHSPCRSRWRRVSHLPELCIWAILAASFILAPLHCYQLLQEQQPLESANGIFHRPFLMRMSPYILDISHGKQHTAPYCADSAAACSTKRL